MVVVVVVAAVVVHAVVVVAVVVVVVVVVVLNSLFSKLEFVTCIINHLIISQFEEVYLATVVVIHL